MPGERVRPAPGVSSPSHDVFCKIGYPFRMHSYTAAPKVKHVTSDANVDRLKARRPDTPPGKGQEKVGWHERA